MAADLKKKTKKKDAWDYISQRLHNQWKAIIAADGYNELDKIWKDLVHNAFDPYLKVSKEDRMQMVRDTLEKHPKLKTHVSEDGLLYHRLFPWGYADVLFEELKVDVNLENRGGGYDGRTFLFYCVKVEQVKYLIERGADIEHQDTLNRFTPHLFLASGDHRYWPCLFALLEAGADVNYQDNLGRTCLMHMAYAKDQTKLLIEKYGARTDLKNYRGQTAWDLCPHQDDFMNRYDHLKPGSAVGLANIAADKEKHPMAWRNIC